VHDAIQHEQRLQQPDIPLYTHNEGDIQTRYPIKAYSAGGIHVFFIPYGHCIRIKHKVKDVNKIQPAVDIFPVVLSRNFDLIAERTGRRNIITNRRFESIVPISLTQDGCSGVTYQVDGGRPVAFILSPYSLPCNAEPGPGVGFMYPQTGGGRFLYLNPGENVAEDPDGSDEELDSEFELKHMKMVAESRSRMILYCIKEGIDIRHGIAIARLIE